MQKTILCLFLVGFAGASRIHSSRIAAKRMLAQETAKKTATTDKDGVEKLQQEIDTLSGGSAAGADAKELLNTLFGGLAAAGLLQEANYDPSEKEVTVVLSSDAVGEMATKSKVPYETRASKTMSAKVEAKADGAIELSMTGLYFAPPPDTQSLFEEVLEYKATAAADKKQCQKECAEDASASEPPINGIACESCVAYEWYKTHKDEVAAKPGKMARILTKTPFGTSALRMEKQQGNWTPSLVGDKNRRRIIYSMLAAAPARIEKFIFGTQPTDFGAPAETLNHKKKAEPTYKTDRYMAAISTPDFQGNADLEAFFLENNLATKSLEIGKASLIGKLGTTYDYPLDMAESLGQGTSGINFARMVSAANPILHAQNIFVRPAKPDKVMKMLGLCQEALEDQSKIDSGCGGNDGRILWRGAALVK